MAGLSPVYALSQGKLPIAATVDMLKNGLSSSDDSEALKMENEKYKKQLAAMQQAQTGQSRVMKQGGKVKSASARADGCCVRGKTRA